MIPTVVSSGVVLIVLILLILLKFYSFNLKKNVKPMEQLPPQKTNKTKFIVNPILETLWSIGTSVAATVVVT